MEQERQDANGTQYQGQCMELSILPGVIEETMQSEYR